MTIRERLSDRRIATTIAFEHRGHEFSGRYSVYPDGRLAEVFLDSGKSGTQLSTTMQDSAIAASLALQFGCPAETLRHAFLKNDDGTGAGPLGHIFDMISVELPPTAEASEQEPGWHRRLWTWIKRGWQS